MDFQAVKDIPPGLKEKLEKRLSGGYVSSGISIPENRRTLEDTFSYLFEKGHLKNIHKVYGTVLITKHEIQGNSYNSTTYVYGDSSDMAEWFVVVLEKSLYGDWMMIPVSGSIER